MQDLDKKSKASAIITTYLLIYFLGAVFISLIFTSVLKSFNIKMNESDINSYINLLTYATLFLGLGYICFKDLKEDYNTLKEDKTTSMGYKILASYGIFYAINLCINLLVTNIDTYANIVGNLLGQKNTLVIVSDNQSVIESVLKGPSAWAMILAAGFLGPICEELVFRKGIFDACKTKEMGILVSSALFGSIHIISSIGMYDGLSVILMTIPYIFSGVALGVIYVKNDCNIWIPTIVHTLSNLISIFGIMILY